MLTASPLPVFLNTDYLPVLSPAEVSLRELVMAWTAALPDSAVATEVYQDRIAPLLSGMARGKPTAVIAGEIVDDIIGSLPSLAQVVEDRCASILDDVIGNAVALASGAGGFSEPTSSSSGTRLCL